MSCRRAYSFLFVRLGTGNVQHQSPHNLSEKTRFIYTFHMIEGAKGTVYDERNWYVRVQVRVASISRNARWRG